MEEDKDIECTNGYYTSTPWAQCITEPGSKHSLNPRVQGN